MATKNNLPNIPIYIGDWEKDCNVLSLASEAAWMHIIFKMWNNGKQSTYKIPTKGLQNLWRCSSEKVDEIIEELGDYDICGIIIDGRFVEFTCRRYEKENKLSKTRSKAVSNRYTNTNSLQTSNKSEQNTDIDYENENENENETNYYLKNEKPKKENIEFDSIKDDFNQLVENTEIPIIRSLPKKRKTAINNLLKENSIEDFIEAIEKSIASDFLTGKNGGTFKASFDWLTNTTNLNKVLEGNYDNTKSSKSNEPTVKTKNKSNRNRPA